VAAGGTGAAGGQAADHRTPGCEYVLKTAARARRGDDDGRFQCTWYRVLSLHTADDVACPATAQRQHTATRLAQQEDRVMTATGSSSTKADACNLSMDKALNLCIIQGFNNIKRVTCECTESGPRAAPNWECVGTAMCQK
jgi:hypothetical protein